VYPTGYKKGALRPRLFRTKTLIKTRKALFSQGRLEPVGLRSVSNAAINKRSMLSFTKASSFLKLLLDQSKRVHGGSP